MSPRWVKAIVYLVIFTLVISTLAAGAQFLL
ncbi:stressosome-associated protein Prli42 [Hazenella sp. IB182357]|uniref:Stressosome-associated protein Prli42 n=1 Tax=Polycladospora coralii TaxID=2771432 RepID=A0A926N715_9BACL|nr:stressosome-associated protein Prli42 [Polycladospora coralii]MBD1372986.1 stressosome-associated protein Prli42 [Polycladospora coralii]MBS7530955.1 stressosome-associated protein Prli42 [Polycladospora coralii]